MNNRHYKPGQNAYKGREGVQNPENFAYVLNGWPLRLTPFPFVRTSLVDSPLEDYPASETGLLPTLSLPFSANHTVPSEDGPFDWDREQQATILGAFFWGYILTQIPGGVLAERFGGRLVFGLGILVTSVFTILTPLAARGGYGLLIICR